MAVGITSVRVLPTKEVELQLAVETGQSYVFEVSTDLIHWVGVGGLDNAPASSITVVDPQPVSASLVRFYRLRSGHYQRFTFSLMHFIEAGPFANGAYTPTVNFPLAISGYSALFDAEGDAPYPAPGEVYFTGPSGSGLSFSPASAENSGSEGSGAWYQSINVNTSTGAPGGTWLVNYRGTNQVFTTDLQPLTRVVAAVPTVVLSGSMLASLSWVYRDGLTGAALSQPPAYMQKIQVQLEGVSGRLYDSPESGDPHVTTHVLTSLVTWSDVRTINLAYDDIDGNHYVLFFSRP